MALALENQAVDDASHEILLPVVSSYSMRLPLVLSLWITQARSWCIKELVMV
jgi:hypothetical protein